MFVCALYLFTGIYSFHIRPQSSQLAEPLWTDPGVKSGISVRELIYTWKKKISGGEWIFEHLPKIFASEEKATITTSVCNWGKKNQVDFIYFLSVTVERFTYISSITS